MEIEKLESIPIKENKDLIDEGIFDGEGNEEDDFGEDQVNLALPDLDIDNEDDYFEAITK